MWLKRSIFQTPRARTAGAPWRLCESSRIGRFDASVDQSRSTFRALGELAVQLRTGRPGLGAELSMGMSDDFEIAVQEGATIVRVGRALFGERRRRDEAETVDRTP